MSANLGGCLRATRSTQTNQADAKKREDTRLWDSASALDFS